MFALLGEVPGPFWLLVVHFKSQQEIDSSCNQMQRHSNDGRISHPKMQVGNLH